ncbi:ABC transporter [Erysipelatoclostridium sp. An173]|uniref:ABC transporter ATP-binding protein n=1 Tax=Erysipelatoclostridium sp. An173 TaxID=1965571 RepID=UPI000B3652BF|nr:ABC transporter ATP-binding protein [Erysipelatoclostridium sp. An173]OUP77138.1 ABC transporter [Erysipelatoclostridium sp. An173]
MNALEIKNISKTYKNFKLDDISFVLPCGHIMGLIGENGAGKSTIINCILDIIEKDSGSISVLGQKNDKNNVSLKENIGVVLDASDVYDNYTVKQVENIMKDVYKQWNHEVYDYYIQKFALPLNKMIKDFSRGMKMKMAITIALSHQPKLLILDEATSGLDPIMRDEILDVFMEFVQDENHAILLSSHISSDLEKIADYITFIHEGKLILSTSKDELIYEYGLMKCRNDEFDKIEKEDIIRYRIKTYEVEILVKDREKMAKKYPNCIVDPTKLDDIMMLYVKGEQI